MKRLFVLVLVVAFFAMASVSFATIANTKHNLTTGGAGSSKTTDATATLCGFCHIPHGSSNAATGLPLWARSMPAASYTLYGTTLFGTTVGEPGKFSKTCLSCHDGTIALGTVIKNGVDKNYTMDSSPYLSGDLMNAYVGAEGYKPLIGTDLTNDHPVGFEFPASGYNVVPADNKPGIDIVVQASGSTAAYLNGAASSNKYPMFQTDGTDTFECATCHDPHLEASGTQTKFLRGPNATLCQDCHNVK